MTGPAASPPPVDDAPAPAPGPAPAPEPAPELAPTSEERRASWWAETKVDLKWATALLFVFVLVGPIIFPPLASLVGVDLGDAGYAQWRGETTGTENLTAVTTAFFDQAGLLVPFEVLSVLLLAALVAGVVIALRDVEGGV